MLPNRAAVIRLIGAVLAQQHDEWVATRRYKGTDNFSRAHSNFIGCELDKVPVDVIAEVS